ncbi:MAG: hypothetical protein J6R71_06090 [Bacteroidales bacterium]|nr:hypothetical protein [Bacteroidales bacterium]
MLARKNKEKQLSLPLRLLMRMLKPKFRLKVIGEDKLLNSNEAFVIVGNHGMWHSPVGAVLNLNVPFRPWIHDVVLQQDSCQKEILILMKNMRWLPEALKKTLARLLAKRLITYLNEFRPIPVRRGCSREAINTLTYSVEALKNGENLLIFPEQPRSHGASIDQEAALAEPLRELYTGFAQLGRLYYQTCGRHLHFFPMYIHRQKKTLCIGEPVVYKHLGDAFAEKQLISKQLYQALRAMEKQEQAE